MNLQRTAAAALLALLCAGLSHAEVPVLRLEPTRPAAQSVRAAPIVTFSVPRYALSERERDLVASCLVLEAASQGEFGMRGVMAVIRNRAGAHPELFLPTVLREKQFSAFNRLTAGRESEWRVIHRAQADRMWPAAVTIVDQAASENWYDPTDGATHYTRTGEHTRWTHALALTVTIGRHAFYR